MAIGASAYKLVFDVQGLETLTASRREIALSKKVAEETRPAMETYAGAWDSLNRVLNKGLISVEQYNQSLVDLKSELPDNASALKALEAVHETAASTRRSLMTADEKLAEAEREYAKAVEGAKTLLDARILTEQQYAKELENLAADSPAVLEAERERAELLKVSQDILASLTTDEQKFAATREKAFEAMKAGLITEEDYNKVLAKSPEAIEAASEAERQRAAQEAQVNSILEKNMTTEEKLNKELETAHRLRKELGEENYSRELKRIHDLMPANIAEQKKLNELHERGKALDEQYMPTRQKAGRDLAELTQHYRAGRVSVDSYRAGWIQLTATKLTGIPIIGQTASTLASVGPAGMIAAAAFGGLAIAAHSAREAMRAVIRNIGEQITKIDDLITASQTLDIPVGKFQEMSHAADMADISQQELSQGTEKLLDSVSKAATGSTRMERAFNIMGLSADDLRDKQPSEIFDRVTRAMDKIPMHADRVRVSMAIFGSPDFLRMNTSAVERTRELFEQLDAQIKPFQEVQFNAMDDSLKNMNLSLDVTWKKVTLAVVPAIKDFAELATEILVDINRSETFTDTLDEVSTKMMAITAIAREVPGVLKSWNDALPQGDGASGGFDPTAFLGNRLKMARAMLGAASAAIDPIGETAKESSRLDAELAAIQAKHDEVAKEKTKSIDKESEAIDKLLEKLKEEIATRGMSAAQAKVWKLEQLGATAEVIAENRKLAEEYDAMEKADKAAQAVKAFTDSLRLQGEAAEDSARRMADLKLEQAGVDEVTRKSLMAQYDASEANKKAAEDQKKAEQEAKRHLEALEKLEEGLRKTEVQLRGYDAALGTHEDRTRAGARAALEWQLTQDKADETTRKATLGHFDAVSALEKRQKATEAFIQTEEDLLKQMRQVGMTEDEKKLDELRLAGVDAEQLKIVETLQKELQLRKSVQATIASTTSAIKDGSREAQDAFAKAERAAAAQSLGDMFRKREQKAEAARQQNVPIEPVIRQPVAPTSPVAAANVAALPPAVPSETIVPSEPATTSTPIPQPPVVTTTTNAAQQAIQQAAVRSEPVIIREPQLSLTPVPTEPAVTSAIVNADGGIGRTVTGPTINQPRPAQSVIPKPMVVNQDGKEQLKLQKEANGYLKKLADSATATNTEEVVNLI